VETTQNTVTRTVTLRITEEDLKRAIEDTLGPITIKLDKWDLVNVEHDYIEEPTVIDFTFELETEHPDQRLDPNARSSE
jgi:hypothetical protein